MKKKYNVPKLSVTTVVTEESIANGSKINLTFNQGAPEDMEIYTPIQYSVVAIDYFGYEF